MIDALLAARDNASLLDPPGLDMPRAYEVGARLREALVARGYRMVGRKIGFTNEAIWPNLGLNEPIWAPIYEQTVRFRDGRHSLAGAIGPRIELEVVLELTAVSPLRIGWVALGFEIVQCHYPDWTFTCADAVADFGLHRALHIGEPMRDAEGLDGLSVSLTRDGEEVARGEGRDVLGGPVRALGCLARILEHQTDEPPLSAGEIVTTGTMTGALPIAVGERWEAEVLRGPSLTRLALEITD
jgi:2-oxo-3-hexenedioate decarboxylase